MALERLAVEHSSGDYVYKLYTKKEIIDCAVLA